MQIVSRKFYIFLTSTPAAFLILFYSFVLRAYLALGQWPRPYMPDPAELEFNIHGILAVVSVVLAITGFLPWIGVTIASWYKKSFSKKFLLVTNIIYIISVVSVVLLVRADPGRFMEWFMD